MASDPHAADPHGSWARERVARLLADAPRNRLVAVVVSSIDGVVAVDGRSAALSSAQDRALIGAWREAADVLLVGPSTLAAELYGAGLFPPEARERRRARGVPGMAPLVTIDRSGTLDLDRALRAREPLELIVYVPPGATRRDPRAIWVEQADLSPATVTLDLRQRFRHELIVAEPGPRLLHSLMRERVLSDLSLTISPVIVGAGPTLWGASAARRSGGLTSSGDPTPSTDMYRAGDACTSSDIDRMRSVDVDVRDGVIFVQLVPDDGCGR